MLTVLSLTPAVRDRGRIHHDEWMIGGTALRAWIAALTGDAAWDVVGLPADSRVANRMIDVLRRRGEPELESGRAVLYRCPECLDLGCGALAVQVSRSADTIVWSDFAWETDYAGVAPMADETFGSVPSITFDASQYDAVLRLRAARI